MNVTWILQCGQTRRTDLSRKMTMITPPIIFLSKHFFTYLFWLWWVFVAVDSYSSLWCMGFPSPCRGFSCFAGSVVVALWDLSRPAIKLLSSELAGGFLTTGPSGKSYNFSLSCLLQPSWKFFECYPVLLAAVHIHFTISKSSRSSCFFPSNELKQMLQCMVFD